MTLRIPLAKPEITDADRDAVMAVLRTPQLSLGPKVGEFEQAICEYTGSKFAVAVNSGTSALHVAVRGLRLKAGDEVILPSFTFSAVLNVILQEGLRPKFVDIDPATYNTTPELIAAAITERTRLIIAVHTFGFPVDAVALRDLAAHAISHARPHSTACRAGPRHTIHLIEDSCEALGAEVRGQKAGAIGEAGLFAFYPNKQITTGEGGVLVTSDEQLATHARRLRNQGRDAALDWHQHAEIGFSYRLSDINCALGISQLARIEKIIARRQKLAEIYDRELKRIGEIVRPSLTTAVGRISWFVYPVRLGAEFDVKHRDWICESLARKGIASGRYFAPLHRQPLVSHAFARNGKKWNSQVKSSASEDLKQAAKLKGWGEQVQAESATSPELAQTEFVADRVIALPFFNELTEAEIQEVCGALEESIRELRRKT
jgi:perosamine synthetase